MITKMKINNQDGATVVEFAIIVPILLLLIFGIIEFSLLLFNQHIITNSSREGARAGIVARENRFTAGDSVNVINTVNDWIVNHLITFGGTGNPVIEVQILGPGNTFAQFDTIDETNRQTAYRNPLKVRVSYEYHFLFLSAFRVVDKVNLLAETEMLME